MFRKTATSTVALAAAIAFGTTAFAQTMVGTQEVSEEDMQRVEEHCAMLAADEGATGGATTDTTTGGTTTTDGAGATGTGTAGTAGTTAGADAESTLDCPSSGFLRQFAA